MNAAVLTCSRTSCSGRIDDGYCDVCGLAPSAEPAPSAPSAPESAPATAPSGTSVPSGASGPSRTQPTGPGTGPSGPGNGAGPSGFPRGMPGARLTEVPPDPYRDPESAVLTDPEVPEHKRFCGGCDAPVGRGRDGGTGRGRGFCARCGTRYSFMPALFPGDILAAQYEVLGCLAHGGTGWVYLARDRGVSGRWVALKGMIGSDDPDLHAVAAAERRFLAEVEHPNIGRTCWRTGWRPCAPSATCTTSGCSTATSSPTTPSTPATTSS